MMPAMCVSSETILARLEPVLKIYSGRVADVRVVPNRGRDIGPLFTSFGRKWMDEYDVIGHLHSKKSADLNDGTDGRIWFLFLLENMIGGHHAMADTILNQMEKDPSIGLVFPDDPYALGWAENYQYAESLCQKMGVHTLPQGYLNFPVGTMFWARSKALEKLVDLGLNWEDYPVEPLPCDGSVLHALERLLPVVSEDAGYRTVATHVPGVTR